MRKVINGSGQDTTQQVLNWLLANNELYLANLYLLGEPDDPDALWLTDWQSPLIWSIYSNPFLPASIKRGKVSSAIGFKVAALDVTWNPINLTFTSSIATTSPYQLTWLGKYDNRSFRAWTVYMPKPGDANTFGASELFGGRVGSMIEKAGSIQFKVNSFLDVVNQLVPTATIDILGGIASYQGASPPTGFTQVPKFNVISATLDSVVGDCTFPTLHQVFATNAFQYGFLVFNRGGTLDGIFTAIRSNSVAGGIYNEFILLAPLPWTPTLGLDTFFVSAPFPVDEGIFPYVPPPETAI